MLKTSREQYNHLNAHHCLTRRSLREKRGRGIYIRVFHWMEPKSIKPLKGLAEVNTLTGSCTLESQPLLYQSWCGRFCQDPKDCMLDL